MQTDTALFILRDGYSKAKRNPPMGNFRPLSAEEAKTTRGEIYFTSDFATFRRCRVSGSAKTWKTRPDVELPIKYGMYESARAVSRADGRMYLPNGGILLVQVQS